MKTSKLVIVCLLLAKGFFCCKTKEKAAATVPAVTDFSITYTNDIKPLMDRSCTPCHYPETGKKKLYHTYAAVSKDIKVILNRVKLPIEDVKYMPYRGKRQGISKEEIALIEKWVANGKPE